MISMTRGQATKTFSPLRGCGRTFLASAVLALFIAAPSAQANDDFGSPGLYLGGGFALGLENFEAPNLDFETGKGLDFWLGYRLARFLALEGQVQWVPGMESTNSVSATELDPRPIVYTANLKGYIPLGRLQPYGLIGIGGLTTMPESGGSNQTGFATKFGAGLELYITKNLAGVASWNYNLATGDVDAVDFNTLTFGAQLCF